MISNLLNCCACNSNYIDYTIAWDYFPSSYSTSTGVYRPAWSRYILTLASGIYGAENDGTGVFNDINPPFNKDYMISLFESRIPTIQNYYTFGLFEHNIIYVSISDTYRKYLTIRLYYNAKI